MLRPMAPEDRASLVRMDSAPALEAAFNAGGVQVVVVPIDYSENKRVLNDELRKLIAGPGLKAWD